MYSSACQRVQRLTRLPTLAFPAIAPTFGLRKCGTRCEIGVGRDDRVGVDADEDLFVGQMFEPEVQGFSFPGVGLGEDQHAAFGFFLREGADGQLPACDLWSRRR